MVKDTPVWVSIPVNVGGRLADLTEWATNGAQTSAGNANPSLLYSAGAAAALAGMGLWWMWNSQPEGKIEPLVDPDAQTRALPDGSRVCKYLRTDELMRTRHSDATTLYEAVRRGARISKNGPMLGYRKKLADGSEPYQWLHYNDVIDRSSVIAHAFRALEQPAGQECFIGVYAKNRPEWIVVEQATYTFNNVLVPLYETLGAQACVFIINQTQLEVIVCDTVEKANGLLKEKATCPSLKHIVILVPDIAAEMRERASAAGVTLYTFEELEQLGRAQEQRAHVAPRPEDLATICYTSGTTGTPKGVMLTHGNVIADGTTLEYFKNVHLDHNDVQMSFLPLAHMFERVVQSVVYTEGGRVGFFRGDIRGLPDDIKELRPTILPVVPRVLNRVYDKVMAEVNKSVLKKALFDTAMAIKTREISNYVIRNNSFFDNLVFKKVREGMGGRVKLMITGSAPLAENVLTFVRCALGCVVVEGYGQTECVACSTITTEGDYVPGHVGVPSPCNAIKLVDVAELGYFARDQAGEVCIRGTNVFKGYYKNEEQTRETLDEDGWLHTGDIGRWTERGTLKIVDRKKHIFKLAQGEYVAPEKIENIYTRSKYVQQVFVHGESLKTCLIAIVVPDAEVLPRAIEAELGLHGDLEQLCREPAVKKLVLDDMLAVGKKAGLYSFEQVKDIHLSAEAFSVENDLLTPTLKSKRPQLKKHFAEPIEAMYSRLD